MSDEQERKLDPSAFKHKVPILTGLPAWLKEPEAFVKVEKALYESLRGSCATHAEVIEAAACIKCQRAFYNRSEMMRKLGFRDAAQYMAWKRVHQKIKERISFPKYNS